jgi:hypothetical protein
MTMYLTARSVWLPMHFPLGELPLHGKAAMCTWYLVGPNVIMPKRRFPDEVLVEEIIFIAVNGVEYIYNQRDLVRDRHAAGAKSSTLALTFERDRGDDDRTPANHDRNRNANFIDGASLGGVPRLRSDELRRSLDGGHPH